MKIISFLKRTLREIFYEEPNPSEQVFHALDECQNELTKCIESQKELNEVLEERNRRLKELTENIRNKKLATSSD